MKYIQKQFAAEPIKGKIVDTTNITDDITNTYSARIIHELIQSIDSEGFGDSTPVGSGMDYYGTVAPENYMFADGSAISRIEYPELFAVIGTTYGAGDGSTTFNLPDKRGRVGVPYNSSSSFFNELGKTGGSTTVTLTTAEMPSHTHIQNAHTHTVTLKSGDGPSGAGWTWLTNNGNTATYTSGSTTAVNQNTGGGGSHNNVQPYLVCNYIIKVKSTGANATSTILAALEGEY